MQHDDQPLAQTAPHGRVISHLGETDTYDATLLASIKTRLRQHNDRSAAEMEHLLQLVDALWAMELGRFLLRNRGLNAY